MKGSEFEARRRHLSFIGVEDHPFNEGFFSGRSKVGLFAFDGFGFLKVHFSRERLNKFR